MIEKSYPARYKKEMTGRYSELVAKKLKVASKLKTDAGEVGVEERIDPERAELLLVEDASLTPKGMVNFPECSSGLRADVVYIDEVLGRRVRFSGPLGGGYQDQPPKEPQFPSPLPALLWRERVEPGVWVAVSGDRAPLLIRVTVELLERGYALERDLGLSKSEESLYVADL